MSKSMHPDAVAARRDFAKAMRAKMSPEEKEAEEWAALERDMQDLKDREAARRDFARALADEERWQRAENSRSAESRVPMRDLPDDIVNDESAASARERMIYRHAHAAEGPNTSHPQYGRQAYSGYVSEEWEEEE